MKEEACGASIADTGGESVSAWTMDRRAFMGVSLASTVGVAAPLFAIPPASVKSDPADLHFFEDQDGLIVVQYANPDSKSRPDLQTTRSWRLLTRRFSDKVHPFRLRTLLDGAQRGYEVRVIDVRFGATDATNHYFIFLRRGDRWFVRMRTELWLEPESTSTDVDFTALSQPNSETKFLFPPSKSADRLAQRLSQVFEDHVRFNGTLVLAMKADTMWTLTPGRSGSIRVFDGVFELPSIEFGWRDIGQGTPHVTSAHDASPVERPVFLALSDSTIPASALVLGSGQQPQISLQARPMRVSRAGGGNSGMQRSATGAPVAARDFEPAPKAPHWMYRRDDWPRGKSGSEHGTSTIVAAWTLSVRQRAGLVFGPVDISEGLLQLTHADPLSIQFVGRPALTQPGHFTSPIGELRVQGWPHDESELQAGVATTNRRAPHVGISCAGLGTPVELVDIPLLVRGIDLAVPDCDFSEFTFKNSVLHAVFARSPAHLQTRLRQGNSYVWLGSTKALPDFPLSSIDLSRARLRLSQTDRLAHLAFLFAGLHLEVRQHAVSIVDTQRACPLIQRADPSPKGTTQSITAAVVDVRPTLIVEFSGQHVFEESIFRPNSAALPDVKLTDVKPDLKFTNFKVDGNYCQVDWSSYKGTAPSIDTFPLETSAFVRAIAPLPLDQRVYVRRLYANAQVKAEKESDKPFGTFSKSFEDWFSKEKKSPVFPSDQAIYIGPLGMDADVAAATRSWRNEAEQKSVQTKVVAMLKRANLLVQSLKDGQKGKPPDPTVEGTILQFAFQWLNQLLSRRKPKDLPPATYARLTELAAAATMSDYGFFRDFYAETMIRWRHAPAISGLDVSKEKALVPNPDQPNDFEFFSASNRDDLAISGDAKAREDRVAQQYASQADERSLPKELMRGRLAGASRLAFRVDCDATIPFSFDALTDWSPHELAVTPRATQMPVFNDGGELIRGEVADEDSNFPDSPEDPSEKDDQDLGYNGASSENAATSSAPVPAPASSAPASTPKRSLETTDIRMLRSLGFSDGRFVTAQERLAEVEAALKVAPTALETAIELPARLILSPSQNASWRTRRSSVPWPRDKRGPVPLWTADLRADGLDPMVRAVHSPDLRPGFVRGGLERALAAGKSLHTPAVYAPPRGPLAPWTLGIEQGDGQTSNVRDLAPTVDPPPDPAVSAGTPSTSGGTPASAVSAGAPSTSGGTTASGASATDVCDPKLRRDLHPLLRYLCTRKDEASGNQSDKDSVYGESAIFRSSLDAYDRHELVLLSSAHGLPVRGRRDDHGTLQPVQTSSQVEMPALWQPKDVERGTALYRPRQLKIQELSLSALGGTLRHDTDFVPPSAARHVLYGPLYDSLSIERWQHWVVLGRDVFAEVVYKGYLFPIGHRASLVKQTERVFLRGVPSGAGTNTKPGPMRAYLRQRMFIRIGQPDKVFPAPGQPNGGRQFPTSRVRMLTRVSPDIVDPSDDFVALPKPDDVAPGGRLFPAQAGLVFWPRTARVAGAEVPFDFQIEGATTRAPLLFVDNVAANRPDLLAQVVDVYNGLSLSPNTIAPVDPLVAMRSLEFAGQSLRYCDETKPGSASHKTAHWNLRASGGAGGPPGSSDQKWEGTLEKFDDPSLEGADQPPFYPVLDSAVVRLDQVERMTGSGAQPVTVQLDGWYIRNGFYEPNGSVSPPSGSTYDPLQIYLDVVSKVGMSMGNNGDRSGGVFRPGGHVLALCRTRGPLTGDVQRRVPGPGVGTVVDQGPFPPESVIPQVAQPAGAVATASKGTTSSSAAFASYFKESDKPEGFLQCRILGLVTFSQLLDYIDRGHAGNSLPLLQDALEYGSAETGAGIEGLRKNVLEPLEGTVLDLEAKWKSVSGPPSDSLTPTLAEIFPDVDQALADLLSALHTVNSSTGDSQLISSLAAVYDSGRRLVDACARVLANPLDAILLVLGQELDALSSAVTKFEQNYNVPLKPEVIFELRAAVANADAVQRLFGYPFDWMNELDSELRATKSFFQRDQSAVIDKAIAAFDNSQPKLVDLIAQSLDSAFGGNASPQSLADTLVDTVNTRLLAALRDAKVVLSQGVAQASQGSLSVGSAGGQPPDPSQEPIKLAQDLLDDSVNKLMQEAPGYGLVTLGTSVDAMLTGASRMSAASSASTLNMQQVTTLFGGLASYFTAAFGNALLPTPEQLKSLLDKAVQPIRDTIKLIADATVAEPVIPKKSDNPSDFAVPTDWKPPGSTASLVGSLDRLAHAAEGALKSTELDPRTQPGLAQLRQDLAQLGYDALDAQIDVRKYAKAIQDDIDALEAIKGPLINKPLQVKKLVNTSASSIRDIGTRLNRLVDERLKPLSRDAKDASVADALSASDVIPAVRTVVTQGLQLLMQMNAGGMKFLEDLRTLNPDFADRVQKAAQVNQDTLSSAVDFDNPRRLISTSDKEWVQKPMLWWPTLHDPLLPITPEVVLQAAVVSMQRMMANQVENLATTTSEGVGHLLGAFQALLKPLAPAYKSLAADRATAWNQLQATPLAVVSSVLLVGRGSIPVFPPDSLLPAQTPLNPGNDQLLLDAQSLERLGDSSQTQSDEARAQALRYIKVFVEQWASGSSSPQRLLQQIKRVSVEDLRARLLSAFDFAALREEVEDQIKRLIPVAATVTYDFKTAIGSGASAATRGVFQPSDNCQLSVHSTARVDFTQITKPTFMSEGSLGKFDIKLIGTAFDAVTLHFDGVSFKSTGGPVSCDMKYAGFTLGSELQFLEQLEPFFNSPPGSGFYLKALDTGLGLEAGYGLPVGTISLGDISFFNISLNAAARLRFDDKQATFVASLSRRDAPFTISAAPYGGSGFFALEADATGIVGFEASFEYGGAGAFAYGPLAGQGRLMVGIYIRSTRSSTDISATFYAGGSASIWVFSFGASLYVCARPDGNRMVGDATFTFSFSMGLVDFDYSCNVHVSLAWGGGGGGTSMGAAEPDVLEEKIMLAEAEEDPSGLTLSDASPRHAGYLRTSANGKGSKKPARGMAGADVPLREVDTWCQAENWREYIDYFDLGLGVVPQEIQP